MEEKRETKRLHWVGSSKKDLLALPEEVAATPKADTELIRQRLKAAEQIAKELES